MEEAAVDMCLLDVDKRFDSLGLSNRYNQFHRKPSGFALISVQNRVVRCAEFHIRKLPKHVVLRWLDARLHRRGLLSIPNSVSMAQPRCALPMLR